MKTNSFRDDRRALPSSDREPRFRATAPAILTAALTLALAGCGSGGSSDSGADGRQGARGASPETGATLPAVEVVRSRTGRLPRRERFTGTVRAGNQVTIYPEVTGPVVEVRAENGDRVEEGDTLVLIRSETSRSQLRQARANLAATRAELESAEATMQELESRYERAKALAEEAVISQQDLEASRADAAAARAEYRRLEAQVEAARATIEERAEAVSQSVVRAPVEGVVGRRNAYVGQRVDGQTYLYTIGRLEDMRVEVSVPQELLSELRTGQEVEIQSGSLADTVVRAEISRISPFLEEGTFSGEVEIDVQNHRGLFMPGMFVTVDVLYGETSGVTLVPKSALYDHPVTGARGVYVVTSGHDDIHLASSDSVGRLSGPVDVRFVETPSPKDGRQVVGVEDVTAGEWVVVVGQHLLADRPDQRAIRSRIRPVSWDWLLDLQRLQREDLVRQFMAKQQEMARRLRDSLESDSATGPADRSSI